MKIYFLRHGETDENAKKTYFGSTDTMLNKNGKAQAEKAKQYFSSITFRKVLISEKIRTLETANIVLEGRDISSTIDSRLNEIDFGIFEGKTYEEIGKLYPSERINWDKNWKDYCPPNGESFITFYKRVENFMKDLLKMEEDNILVITHGGVIRAAYAYILNENLDLYWKFASRNGDISVIKYENGFSYFDSIISNVKPLGL